MINFLHSEESFFFPTDFYTALIIFIIFISLLLIYRHYFKFKHHHPSRSSSIKNEKPVKMEDTSKLDIDEKLTIIGIILTIIFTGIYPFIQKPLLDYSIVDDNIENNGNFSIKVINRGFDTANDVIISLKSTNNSFKAFTLEPFINYTIDNSSSKTRSYVQVESLPPGSQTIINAELNSSSPNSTVTTYVRSQESTGHYDALIKIIFYLSITIMFGFIFIYLSYWDKLKLSKPNNWKILHEREIHSLIYIMLIIFSYIVIFSFGYHMLINKNNPNMYDSFKIFYLTSKLSDLYLWILGIFIFIFGISIMLFIKQENISSIKKR